MAKKIIEEEILEIKEEIENIDRTIAMYNSRITYYQREVLIEKKCLEDQQETLLMAQSNLKCFDGGRTSSGRGSGGRGRFNSLSSFCCRTTVLLITSYLSFYVETFFCL